jgi:SAM-dependent methyltransferase
MDDPAIGVVEHRAALAGLSRINAISGAWRGLWRAIGGLAREHRGGARGPLRVLDVATGSGDAPINLARQARRCGVELELWACDVSAVALGEAQRRAQAAGERVRTFVADAQADDQAWAAALAHARVRTGASGGAGEGARGAPGFDVVMCSLFLHHLDGPDVTRVLARMGDASSGLVLAHDLERSAMGLTLASVVPRLLTRSRVVHVDAVRSVRGAYTREELLELAGGAGLLGARVTRAFPCRLMLEWRRDAGRGPGGGG